MEKLTVVELKQLLQGKGSNSSGNKAELMQRAEALLLEEEKSLEELLGEIFGVDEAGVILRRQRRKGSMSLTGAAAKPSDSRMELPPAADAPINEDDNESLGGRSARSVRSASSSISSNISEAKLHLKSKLAAEKAKMEASREMRAFKQKSTGFCSKEGRRSSEGF